MALTPLEKKLTKRKINNEFSQKYAINSRAMDIAYPLAQKLVLPFYFKNIDIRGGENVPKTGATIIAPTHRSRWDAIIVPYATGRLTSGRDLRFLVSSNEMKGIQGYFVSRMGGFPVDTDRPSIASFRRSVEILRQKEMLAIFPEGGIFQDRELNPLKDGVARIALQASAEEPQDNIKIVPVSIHYSPLRPRWRSSVYIDIGKPLETRDYSLTSLKKSTKQLTNDLEMALGQLVCDRRMELR
jgi:1-acyl-sn-glycerol-3-phosphate acyltransferase